MNKILNSIVAISVALVIYILSGASDFVETLCLLGFFLNGFYYTYTLEYLPRAEESLKSPSVFLYRKQRLNLFGYLNSGIFLGMTLLFFVLQSILQIKLGIIIFVCWALMIFLFKIASQYTQRATGDEEYLFEYMFDAYPQYQGVLAFLSRTLPDYPSSKISEGYFIVVANVLINANYAKDQVEEFINTYKSLYNNLLDYSSDEVRAIDNSI